MTGHSSTFCLKDRSKITSMFYGVSTNGNKGLGYTKIGKSDESHKVKPKSFYEHFVPGGTEIDCFGHTQKKSLVLKPRHHAQTPLDYPAAQKPNVVKNSEKNNKIRSRKWVPKNKIIYVTDILKSSVKTPVMVPEQWMLTMHDGQKAYVPSLELEPGGFVGFEGNQNGKIICSGTIGNGNLHSITNILWSMV